MFSGWDFKLKLHLIVPLEAPLPRYFETGDLERTKGLFKHRLASPLLRRYREARTTR